MRHVHDVRQRDAPGDFDNGPAFDPLDRLPHHLRGHVIEQNDIRASLHGLPDIGQGVRFDHNPVSMRASFPGEPARCREGDALGAQKRDMVVLDHRAVSQRHAMIAATAEPDRPLLQGPQPWECLPCVKHAGPVPA